MRLSVYQSICLPSSIVYGPLSTTIFRVVGYNTYNTYHTIDH